MFAWGSHNAEHNHQTRHLFLNSLEIRENTAKVEQSNAEINSTPEEKHYHTHSPHSALLTKLKEVVNRAGSSATIRYDWLEKNKLLVRSFFHDRHQNVLSYCCNISKT